MINYTIYYQDPEFGICSTQVEAYGEPDARQKFVRQENIPSNYIIKIYDK